MEMCANAANCAGEIHAASFPVESTGRQQTEPRQVAEVPTIFTSSISHKASTQFLEESHIQSLIFQSCFTPSWL